MAKNLFHKTLLKLLIHPSVYENNIFFFTGNQILFEETLQIILIYYVSKSHLFLWVRYNLVLIL